MNMALAENKKIGLSLFTAGLCAVSVVILRRMIVKRRKPFYRPMHMPSFAYLNWNSLEIEELQKELLKGVLAHPGLIFDPVDPFKKTSELVS